MSRPFRILVTGSRDWQDEVTVWAALDATASTAIARGRTAVVVVHGACPTGADEQAAAWCADSAAYYESLGIELSVESHPADWAGQGRAAGPMRNAAMVQLGADAALAFIRNGSRGATGCAELAEDAGIPVRRWTA